jgi:PAS domain S-box-containing protein
MSTATILVVDDDRDTRELYGLVFKIAGQRILEAGSVGEGFRQATVNRPDVIITDWRLGDGDGFDLCRRLRAHGATRRVPIVAITGVSLFPDQLASAYALGVHAILTKPVDVETLPRTVADALRIRASRTLRAAAKRMQRYARHARRDASAMKRGAVDMRATASMLIAHARAQSHVALIVADDSGRYVAANDDAVELTGYDSQELMTLSVWDLTAMPAQGQKMWEQFIASGTQEGDYTVRRRDGQSIRTRYVAIANVSPGLHVSALSAAPAEVPFPF